MQSIMLRKKERMRMRNKKGSYYWDDDMDSKKQSNWRGLLTVTILFRISEDVILKALESKTLKSRE